MKGKSTAQEMKAGVEEREAEEEFKAAGNVESGGGAANGTGVVDGVAREIIDVEHNLSGGGVGAPVDYMVQRGIRLEKDPELEEDKTEKEEKEGAETNPIVAIAQVRLVTAVSYTHLTLPTNREV